MRSGACGGHLCTMNIFQTDVQEVSLKLFELCDMVCWPLEGVCTVVINGLKQFSGRLVSQY